MYFSFTRTTLRFVSGFYSFIRCQLVLDWFSALRISSQDLGVYFENGRENLNFKTTTWIKFGLNLKKVILKLTDLYCAELNRFLHNLSRLSFINYDALNDACIHQKFCNEKNHLEVILESHFSRNPINQICKADLEKCNCKR